MQYVTYDNLVDEKSMDMPTNEQLIEILLDNAKFQGKVSEDLGAIREWTNKHDVQENKYRTGVSTRIECVEKKQERFAWYIGIAVGVGMAIMFMVDKFYDFIKGVK